MAKPNNASTIVDWIWLHDALVSATRVFGSPVLAKERLTQWLAAGELPWCCMDWQGLDEEGLARLDRENQESIVLHIIPSAVYHEGDPAFWRTNITIYWEENGAREKATGGARALGIKVPGDRLLELLPEGPRQRDEVHAAKAANWIASEAKKMKAANELPPNIRITEFARELERRMRKASATDKSIRPIEWRSIKNRLPDWGLWPVASIRC